MSHLFKSLESAARMVVIQDGFSLQELNIAYWARTYRCSEDQVREALKIALNGSRKLPEEVAANSTKSIPTEEVDHEG